MTTTTTTYNLTSIKQLIDLNGDAVANYNKFRAYTMWPRTFYFQNNKRIIITDATLENNNFIIKYKRPFNFTEPKEKLKL
jgi:methionyl-tRNA formyltransferase